MTEMTPHQVDSLMNDARIGRLCMADAQGRPYVIPLPFCWDEGAVYVRVALTGRKGGVLRENNRVCFEIDTFSESLDEYASVLVEGRLVPVEEVNEKVRVKALNTSKYMRLRKGYRPGHGRTTPVETLPVQKIVVEIISGRMNDPRPVAVGETNGTH